MATSKRDGFGHLRIAAIGMSKRQVELRHHTHTYLKATGDLPSALALQTGVRRKSMVKFLDGEQVLVSAGLSNLGSVLGVESLCQEIVQLAKEIPDRYMGLVNFDEKVIRIVLDLLEAFTSQSVKCTMVEFAAAFPRREEIVQGALLCTKDILAELRDQPQLVQELLDTLLDDQFEERLREAKETLVRSRQVKIVEVERLVGVLRPRFDDKKSLVKAMGFAGGSLDRTSLLRASEAQLDAFIHTLTAAIGSSDVPIVVDAPEEVLQAARNAIDPFKGLAGGDHDEMSYVLTEADFREITALPVKALLDGLKLSSRITRGYLALVAQLKGEEIRALMQQPHMQREIEELYLALELVSTTHPTALLKLFEKQREQWGSMRSNHKKEL
jgi:hypothetical protein